MDAILSSIAYPQIDPVIVRLGPVAIRWYGAAYVAGFFFAYVLLRRMIHTGRLRIAPSELSDLATWLVLGVIVGGRLGWWLIYHRPTASVEPWYEPVALWHGGMSFHGGLIGVVVALAAWSGFAHKPVWNIADCLALVAPIGLCFGRIANFINGELVGRRTNLPWGVVFPGESFARHPSQLYEAVLEGPVLLFTLWLLTPRARNHPGMIAALFIVLYGLVRFAVEFTRQPDEQIGFIAFGWLTMGQLLSVGLVMAGVALTGVSIKVTRQASRLP
jgi:phosphatidylglycerol---prolipoprotein diacylglyceryl transferase